jgi:hypothetical protein
MTLPDLLVDNRAGPDESHLSLAEIIEQYSQHADE